MGMTHGIRTSQKSFYEKVWTGLWTVFMKLSWIIVAFPLSNIFLAWLTSVIAFIIATG